MNSGRIFRFARRDLAAGMFGTIGRVGDFLRKTARNWQKAVCTLEMAASGLTLS